MRDWTGWPTIGAYLAWAAAQGCRIAHPPARPDAPDALRLVTITAPSGRRALEAIAEDDAPLMSTTVSRLDRRLGLKSGLFD